MVQAVSLRSWVGPLGSLSDLAAMTAAAAAAATHPFQEGQVGAFAEARPTPPLGDPGGVGAAWAAAMEETQGEQLPQVVVVGLLLQVGLKGAKCLGMGEAKLETQVVTGWDLAVVVLE